MRFSSFSAVVLCVLGSAGCSSSESSVVAPATGPAPIAYAPAAVDVSLSAYANAGSERIVDGFFATGRQTGVSCTSETVEGCSFSACTQVDNATPGTIVDPGAVKVTSPSMGTDVPLTLDAKTGYGRIVQSGDFADGEEVRVVAAGGATVAAFDLKVKIPGALKAGAIGTCGLSSGSGSSTCDLPEASPVVRWTGGGSTVLVSLSPTIDGSTYGTLRCAFAGAAGSGQIPAAALAKLPKGTAYRVSVSSVEVAASTAGATPSVGLSSQRRSSTSLASVKLPQ